MNALGKFAQATAISVVIAVVFGPSMIGLLDLAALFLTGQTITGVPWSETRIAYAIAAPIVVPLLALMFVL